MNVQGELSVGASLGQAPAQGDEVRRLQIGVRQDDDATLEREILVPTVDLGRVSPVTRLVGVENRTARRWAARP